MKQIIPPELKKQVIAIIIVIAAGMLMAALLIYINPLWAHVLEFVDVVKPFLYGIALAFVQYPIVKRLDRALGKVFSRKKPHPRLCRGSSATISLLLLLAFVSSFMAILLPQLITSVRQLFGAINRFLQSQSDVVNDYLEQYDLSFISLDGTQLVIAWEELIGQVTNYGDTAINMLMSFSTTISSTLYNTFYQLIMAVISAFYFLMEKEPCCAHGKKLCYGLFKRDFSETLRFWTRRASQIFAGFITGKLIDSLIIGVVCYVMMLLFRFDYALHISVIIGITNILPFFGPFIGAVPSILILLIVNPTSAIWFAIFIIILQQIDGNIIGPLILKDYVGMSPLWILISIVIGGGLFGFIGMLLSIPTFSLLYAIVRTVIERRLTQKGMPTASSYYQSEEYLEKNK